MSKDVARLIEIDHEDTVLRAFMLFVQTGQIVLKYVDAYLYRKTRLSVSKLIILKALDSSSRAMRPSELANWTNTERHNITALISRMKKEGLVTAERDSRSKKFVNINLTDEGRQVLRHAIPVAEEIVDQLMLSTTDGDAALLEEKLRILRQNAYHGLEDSPNRATPAD